MSSRRSPVAELIAAALQVDWARPWIVRELRKRYARVRSIAELARDLGVHPRSLHRWIAEDGELREALPPPPPGRPLT